MPLRSASGYPSTFMKTILAVPLALLLAACASEPPTPREKTGASEDEFMQARDACMSTSTVPFTDASMGSYPASSGAQQAISCPKYDACMTGRGFQRTTGGRFYAPILCRD